MSQIDTLSGQPRQRVLCPSVGGYQTGCTACTNANEAGVVQEPGLGPSQGELRSGTPTPRKGTGGIMGRNKGITKCGGL